MNTNGVWTCEGGCQNLIDIDIKTIQTVKDFCTTVRFRCLRCSSPASLEWSESDDTLSISVNASNYLDLSQEPCLVGG